MGLRMIPFFTVNKRLLDLLWQNFCQHVMVFSFHMKELSLTCCLGLVFCIGIVKKRLPPLLIMFGYNMELSKTGKCFLNH